MTFIPENKYSELVQMLPICCVDIAILHNNKLLMIKRGKGETYGGSWWIVGGRIHKGESWHDAVKRKAKEEVGMDVKVIRQIKSYEFPVAEEKHFVTTLFVALGIGDVSIVLDDTSSTYKWVSEIDNTWNHLLKQMIRDTEVFDV